MAALLAILAGLLAQEAVSCADFVDCARAGTARYRDRGAAILDGYRRIGGDFPAMGEHWIRVGLVFDGQFDPARPEVLSYIVVDDEPVLLGVAYALPLLAGETPPDGPPGPGAWHDHYRTIEDETFLPAHHMPGMADSPRIAMLHAWIWSENPEGTFAADNWAIPYLRLGLEVSEGPFSAARALSLATGGAEHFRRVVDRAVELADGQGPGVQAVFDAAREEVGEVLGRNRGPRLREEETARLSGIWERLWMDLRALTGNELPYPQ
jgi:hypothetical protein